MGGSSGVGMVYFSMAWGVDSTLSPASFFDPLRVQRDAAPIRAEHLQRIPKAPFAALLAGGNTILPAFHSAHKLPLTDISSAVGCLAGLLAAKVEARGVVPVAGTGQLGQNVIAQLKVIVERVGQILIQSLAISGGDAGDIVERLGTALDLQAVHTCLADEVDRRELCTDRLH